MNFLKENFNYFLFTFKYFIFYFTKHRLRISSTIRSMKIFVVRFCFFLSIESIFGENRINDKLAISPSSRQ